MSTQIVALDKPPLFDYNRHIIILEVMTVKKSTKSILRVVISIVYIIWGIWSPLSAFKAVIALDVSAMISAAVGVMTLLSGIFGLLGLKKNTCKISGVIIFIVAVLGIVYALPTISITLIVNAILAWLYILCI